MLVPYQQAERDILKERKSSQLAMGEKILAPLGSQTAHPFFLIVEVWGP